MKIGEIAPDLAPREVVAQTDRVRRFEGFDPRVVPPESVRFHTSLGCMHIRMLKDLDPQVQDRAVQIFAVHDLPEALTGDTRAYLVVDEFAKQKEELRAAQAAGFSGHAIELIEEFHLGHNLLAGRVTPHHDCQDYHDCAAGVIAVSTDLYLGAGYFHRHVAEWARRREYSKASIPEPAALTYAIYETFKYLHNIRSLPVDNRAKEIATSILLITLNEEILSQWCGVSPKRIPFQMRLALQKARFALFMHHLRGHTVPSVQDVFSCDAILER